jgi:putative flippase GtrA
MSSLIGRFRAFRASPHFTRILKFGTVSLIATAVSQTILFAIYPHLVPSAMGSNGIATAISTVPAYTLNRRWTWGKRGKSHLWKEVVPFWAMAFICLVLSTIIVGVAAKNAHSISTAPHFKTLLVHVANLFSYALIWVARYSLLNRFLFGTHTHENADGAVAAAMPAEHVVASTLAASPQAPASVEAVATSASAPATGSISASVGAGAVPTRPVDPSR